MSRGERFKRRALKRGYKVDEVDDFLERAEATLAGEVTGDPLTPEDVRDVVFRTRWGGYDEWQVDLHLDRLERELIELEEGHESHRGSNGFPALPPANRDREDRLALPPGQSATPVAQAERPAPLNAAPGAIAPAAAKATVYVAERGEPARAAYSELSERDQAPVAGALAVDPPLSPRPSTPAVNENPVNSHGGPAHTEVFDSFADLGSDDGYVDPFADHTPKPSFRENFHSSSTTGQLPAITDDDIEDSRAALTPPTANASAPAAFKPNTYGPGGRDVSPPLSAVSGDPYAGRHGKADMTVELPSYEGNLSPFTNEDKALLAKLRSGFKTRRFGSGYDSHQVDRLFDAISAAMEGQATTQIAAGDFDPTQFGLVQGGYFEDEVEAALTQLQALFQKRNG